MGDTHWHLSVWRQCLCVSVYVCEFTCGHWSLEIIVRGEAKLTTSVDIPSKTHDIDLFLIRA